MTIKLHSIALAALVAGAAFAGGFAAMNDAGTAQAAFKLTGTCMPGMKVVGSPASGHYKCLKGILTICKAGFKRKAPTLYQKKTNIWVVEYACQIPPK